MKCPYCDLLMDCDTVDVGVGFVQCGPYHCDNCGASEIGPEAVYKWTPRPLTQAQAEFMMITTEEERRTGFYRGGRHSPYANTVGGALVSHRVAKAAYRMGILDPKPA